MHKKILTQDDALILIDIQKDFLPPTGSLAIPNATEIIPVVNLYIALFEAKGLPIFATRDWHPPDHNSFTIHGGIWPDHCIAETEGAAFANELLLPDTAIIISKGIGVHEEGYSGFDNTELNELLRKQNVKNLYVGGIATEVCVFHTVKEGLKLGYNIFLLEDAIKGVDATEAELKKEEMIKLGADNINLEVLES